MSLYTVRSLLGLSACLRPSPVSGVQGSLQSFESPRLRQSSDWPVVPAPWPDTVRLTVVLGLLSSVMSKLLMVFGPMVPSSELGDFKGFQPFELLPVTAAFCPFSSLLPVGVTGFWGRFGPRFRLRLVFFRLWSSCGLLPTLWGR